MVKGTHLARTPRTRMHSGQDSQRGRLDGAYSIRDGSGMARQMYSMKPTGWNRKTQQEKGVLGVVYYIIQAMEVLCELPFAVSLAVSVSIL